MIQTVYVYTDKDAIDCYFYLSDLTASHPNVPYFKTYRALKLSSTYKTDDYTVAVRTMKYRCKRGFGKKADEW